MNESTLFLRTVESDAATAHYSGHVSPELLEACARMRTAVALHFKRTNIAAKCVIAHPAFFAGTELETLRRFEVEGIEVYVDPWCPRDKLVMLSERPAEFKVTLPYEFKVAL